MPSLRGSGVTPAVCIPRWLEGRAQGRGSCPSACIACPRADPGPLLHLLRIRSQLALAPSSNPIPPKHTQEKNRRAIQYLPPPALAWPLQTKRRAVTPETPRAGPPHTPKQPKTQREGQSRHLPARGPSRRQRATPRTQQAFISPRHTLRQLTKVLSTCRRRDPGVGPATHQGPSLSLSPSRIPGNSLENSSGETQAPRVFRAVLVSVASDVATPHLSAGCS